MGEYRFTIHVEAPPEDVFALWIDLDRAKEWIGGLTRITDVTGPLDRPGARYTAWFGRMRSPTEVLEVERPRYIRSRFGSALLGGETSATFEPEGTGTRLTQVLRTRGIIAAIAARIFATGSWSGSFRGELAHFGRIAEADHRSAVGSLGERDAVKPAEGKDASVNEVLIEAFRHDAWATKRLIAACRGLSQDQLTAPGTAAGTDRGVLAILNHIVQSARGYVSRRGDRPDWADNDEDTADLAELERRAEETGQVWERYLSQPVEAGKLIILDEGAYEAESSVLIVQALHHGNAHREQIAAIMTSLGVEPPDIQAWAYAEATGHPRERRPGA